MVFLSYFLSSFSCSNSKDKWYHCCLWSDNNSLEISVFKCLWKANGVPDISTRLKGNSKTKNVKIVWWNFAIHFNELSRVVSNEFRLYSLWKLLSQNDVNIPKKSFPSTRGLHSPLASKSQDFLSINGSMFFQHPKLISHSAP